MIHEFAVDPGLLCNYEQFRYLIEKFGFHQGRLISRCPKRWEHEVKEVLKPANLTPMQRHRVMEILANAGEKMVDRDVRWVLNLEWLQNAEAEHKRHPFHAILANCNPRNHAAVLPYEDLTEETPLWATQPQRVVLRQAAEMAKTLAPVFRIAKQLVFIDPHFDPCKASAMRSLKAYLQQCWNISPYPRIEFHTRYNSGNTLFQSKCKDLESFIPKGKSLTIICWDDPNAVMHNRYVLTDRGGVSFGWGLAEGSKAGQNDDVVILTRDVYESRWAQYCGSNPGLIKKLELTVDGRKS